MPFAGVTPLSSFVGSKVSSNDRLCLFHDDESSSHTCRCMWCTSGMPGKGSMAMMLTFDATTSSPPLRSMSALEPRSRKRWILPSYGSTLS